MKRRFSIVLLCLCLLLSGCGVFEGSYVSVKPHQEQKQNAPPTAITARDYLELVEALKQFIAAGTESAVILVPEYSESTLPSGMEVATRYVMENDAIGAYAVDAIDYTPGAVAGQSALAVNISYLHTRAEIRRIRTIETMEEADSLIGAALNRYDSGLVLLAKNYTSRDFTQFVEDYVEEYPNLVMQTPQVTANVYGTGTERVVELTFSYQTGRDDLRHMQQLVKPVFEAASMYVSTDSSQWQQYSQLYSFLMERFEYQVETSITPAYSLLNHGVGDSRAFANVYGAMCRAAGLSCDVVKGTRYGEPWSWNMIQDNGYYYHVDLLRCSEQGRFSESTDMQMQGYVWDFSAYPACTGMPESLESGSEDSTEPISTSEETEETVSREETTETED